MLSFKKENTYKNNLFLFFFIMNLKCEKEANLIKLKHTKIEKLTKKNYLRYINLYTHNKFKGMIKK